MTKRSGKPSKPAKKLALKKRDVRKLDGDELERAAGGTAVRGGNAGVHGNGDGDTEVQQLKIATATGGCAIIP